MTIIQRLRAIKVGDHILIPFERDPTGRQIHIFKKCKSLGIFCDVMRIKGENMHKVRRVK